MKTPYWRRLSTKVLLEHPRVIVVEDDVELPTGTKTKYLRFEGMKNYVTIIAERNGKLALLREYSYPHDEWLLQFPEGLLNAGETAQAGAIRELREETGLQTEQMQEIGMIYDSHRRTTTTNYIFLAESVSDGQKVAGDEEEFGTETHWYTVEEVRSLVSSGEIRQKNTLAALALYFSVAR